MPDVPGSPPRSAPSGRAWAIGGLILAALLATGVTLAVALAAPWVIRIDARVSARVQGWADPAGWPVDVAAGMGGVTEPLWSGLVVATLVVVLARARFPAAAIFLAVSGLLGVTAVSVTKGLMGRQRPDSAEGHDVHMHASFPSGHAAAGIYLYVAAGVVLLQLGRANDWPILRWIGRLLIAVGPLIGLSRVVLGVHWPSDVLAGWAFGAVAALTAALLSWDALAHGWRRPDHEAAAGT